MKRVQKSAVAAIVGFALIAALVIGGLAWATHSQLQLVSQEALASHHQQLTFALWRMEERLIALLQNEAQRPFTDYLALYTDDAEVGWTDGGERVDVDTVVVESPLAGKGTAHTWIDLYFQVNEDGAWSSPQVEEGERWASRSARLLYWLSAALPVAELSELIARARDRDPRFIGIPSESHQHTQEFRRVTPTARARSDDGGTAYESRRGRSVAAQVGVIPPGQCLTLDHIQKYHLPDDPEEGALDLFACSPPVEVGIEPKPMAAFWLPSSPNDEGRKIAFVRTGHENDRVVYQGLMVDWDGLEHHLLESVWDLGLFANARLEPIAADQLPDPGARMTVMSGIPARLIGPDIINDGVAEARSSVMGTLIVAWAVAIAALALAGIGIRNLLALTTRRLQFAYAVTHELRTPLTTFQLYTDMLAAGLVPDDSKQEYLESLNRESGRLSRLVQGILEYARLENQRAKLHPAETTASAIVKKIAETLSVRCGENGVKSKAENLVPNGQIFRTDLDLLNQIASVLIDNAVRHAKKSQEPSVRVQLRTHDNRLEVDVIDSGPGVPRSDARRVFKPFRRGSSAEVDAHRGIGLGLALARTWARLLGGKLYLVARNDPSLGGAHFRVSLPQSI